MEKIEIQEIEYCFDNTRDKAEKGKFTELKNSVEDYEPPISIGDSVIHPKAFSDVDSNLPILLTVKEVRGFRGNYYARIKLRGYYSSITIDGMYKMIK